MQDEHDKALRRRVTDGLVLSLHVTGHIRWRADLARIRTFGIDERNAAEVAGRLAVEGLLSRIDLDKDVAYFRLTDEGYSAFTERYRQLAAA